MDDYGVGLPTPDDPADRGPGGWEYRTLREAVTHAVCRYTTGSADASHTSRNARPSVSESYLSRRGLSGRQRNI
jgi:hypothetical protein